MKEMRKKNVSCRRKYIRVSRVKGICILQPVWSCVEHHGLKPSLDEVLETPGKPYFADQLGPNFSYTTHEAPDYDAVSRRIAQGRITNIEVQQNESMRVSSDGSDECSAAHHRLESGAAGTTSAM